MADQGNEALKNCAACKKYLTKAKRYYREGKNYCNKNCWKTLKAKSAAQPGEAS